MDGVDPPERITNRALLGPATGDRPLLARRMTYHRGAVGALQAGDETSTSTLRLPRRLSRSLDPHCGPPPLRLHIQCLHLLHVRLWARHVGLWARLGGLGGRPERAVHASPIHHLEGSRSASPEIVIAGSAQRRACRHHAVLVEPHRATVHLQHDAATGPAQAELTRQTLVSPTYDARLTLE